MLVPVSTSTLQPKERFVFTRKKLLWVVIAAFVCRFIYVASEGMQPDPEVSYSE